MSTTWYIITQSSSKTGPIGRNQKHHLLPRVARSVLVLRGDMPYNLGQVARG
jgi:hypothetical protein